MPNLRAIYDNAADRATLSASSTAGSLVPANLQNDYKSVVWRSTSTSATLTATWSVGEPIAAVALPFCNLSSQATIRVRGYSLSGDTTPVFDTGTVLACPGAPLGVWNWGSAPLGANSYSYGGGNIGRVWIDSPATVQKLVIDIADGAGSSSYIEASRLVCGTYWEPAKNADYGASTTSQDTTKNTRNSAGDLISDLGTKSGKISFSLSKMTASDRSTLWSILRGNGLSKPVFISLFPNDADSNLEQQFQLYGKLVSTPAMSLPSFNIASATVDIEAI